MSIPTLLGKPLTPPVFSVEAKAKVRVASRFLLPLEIFAGLHMLLWGLSAFGIPMRGAFYAALHEAGQSRWIGVSFVTLGGVMAVTALIEWLCARQVLAGAGIASVYVSVSIRATTAFFAMGAWIAGATLAYISITLEHVGAFYGISFLNVAFCWWIYMENLKVRYAINPNYRTSSLEFYR